MHGGQSGRRKAGRELNPVCVDKHVGLSATSLERCVACLLQEPSQLCSSLGLGTWGPRTWRERATEE